jgi:Phosphotransferase enzyme family
MLFVSQNTSLPVPKFLEGWKHGEVTVIIMEYVRGKQLWGIWNRLTAGQHADICSQLEGYVNQLRQLSPPSPSQVSSTSGGACRDHRFGRLPIGPFETHNDFHRFLREDTDLIHYERSHPDVVTLHNRNYVSNFTHGDLALRNIIVQEGKIAAIVDWDSAGWRPEYWEYTKAHFTSLGVPREWFEALRRATGDYEEHLKGERSLWRANEFPGDPAKYPCVSALI